MHHEPLEETMKAWQQRDLFPTDEEKMIRNYITSIQNTQPEDKVNCPTHYTHGGIETIDYLKAKMSKEEFIGFCKGNVLKYLSREAYKNGKEDLKKAQWYLNKLIDSL